MRRLALVALGLAACRFDAGGLAGDDGGDDQVEHDADPNAPDAAKIDAGPDEPDAEAPIRRGVLVAEPAVGAVTLDAVDAEFVAAGADSIGFDIQLGDIYEVYDNQYLVSARIDVRAIHDDDQIYFFIEVDDSAVQVDSSELWNDDSVAIYLDAAGDAAGPFGNDDHEILIRADAMYTDTPAGADVDLSGEVIEVSGGYVMELQIAKDSLSVTLGETLGFDVGVFDDDGWGNADVDAWGVWYTSSRPPCASCCIAEGTPEPWCDTSLYGTLRLD